MKIHVSLLWILSLMLVPVFSACSETSKQPTAADLALRQQLQESTSSANSVPMERRLNIVRGYLDDKNFVNANSEIRQLLITHPEDPEVILLAATCEAAVGDKLAAARMIDAMDDTNVETQVSGLFLAANWFSDENEFDAAESNLRKIIAIHGDDLASAHVIRAHRRLATLMNNQGRRREGATHLRMLALSGEIQEKELFAMNTVGDPFIDASSPKPDFSKQLIPAALAQAKVLRHERDLLGAQTLVEKLAAQFPDSCPISAFQGRVYADLQDDVLLRQWMAKLPDGIESEPEFWYAVGVASQQQSQDREAIRSFAEAVLRDPTDRFSYLAMSRSLTKLGETEFAKRVVKRFDVLEEAARLAMTFGQRPGTREELSDMANLMTTLERPAESIAWRILELKRFGSDSLEIDALVTERERLRDESTQNHLNSAPSESFLTCGLVLSDWPLPNMPRSPLQSDEANLAVDASRVEPAIPLVPIRLIDVANEVGLDFQYKNGDDPNDDSVLLHQLTGGGIGVIDFDLDGWPDLYFTQGGGAAFDANGSEPNQLFRNASGKRFIDVTDKTSCDDRGYGQGTAVADLNQDGFPDLVVANIGPNRIYLNQGDGTFASTMIPAFQTNNLWTTSMACGDLSGDGLPEIVEVNYIDDPTALSTPCTATSDVCNPSTFRPANDVIWRLATDGLVERFDDAWGNERPRGYGFAAVIANFDDVAGNDLFIANDTVENHFWLSQSTDNPEMNQLVESARLYGCSAGLFGQYEGSMGIAQGDFDRNGRLDLYVTNFWDQPADLYLQGDHGFFTNAALIRGLDEPSRRTVAWGTQAVDFDRNGWLDLAVLNGHLTDRRKKGEAYRMRPQLFQGSERRFDLVPSELANDDYWSRETLGRTMAILDWNQDLRPDLICNHLDVAVALLENDTDTVACLQFELIGTVSERDAIGAKVTVQCGSNEWTQWVVGGDGFLCSNEAVIDFGLGQIKKVDSVKIDWPSGFQQQFTELLPNHRYLLIEGTAQPFPRTR